MDFLTVLSYVLAIVETVALIGALVFITRAMHANKIKRTKQGKKGAKNSDELDKSIATNKRNALIFGFIYLMLNFLRNYSGLFN